MNATTLLFPLLLVLPAAVAQARPVSSESAPRAKAINTVCPVMGDPVMAGRDSEVIIREKAYLVCCESCGPRMAKHPAKYLDEGGRPLNDPARNPDQPGPARQKGLERY